MADDDDGFRRRNEESSPATPRCRSPPPMKNTSPRISRDRQPGTSGTSRSRISAPQRINRCKRTLLASASTTYICTKQVLFQHLIKIINWQTFLGKKHNINSSCVLK